MKTDFRLVGLSKPCYARITLLDDTTETYSVVVGMTPKKCNELFDYLKGDWGIDKIAVVEHEKFNYDGFPIDGRVIEVRDWDLNFTAPKL